MSNGTLNAGLDRDTSRADAARGSTVISHAAYIMNQSRYGISRSDLAKIWYKSISYYGSKTAARVATFADCRKAVTQAANDYYMSLNYSLKARADKLEIMNNAFDSANIPGYSSVRQNIAANSTNMSNFVRATSQKYPSGKVWSGSDSNIYYPTFSEGYKKFDYINGGTYDISARFAQQLQTEYYGIKHFLHLTNSANYLPRIGDHLRISSNRSIFITGVSGSTITYVDCNANGDSKVAWSKTGTFTKNSNGTFRIKLGSTYYSFVWVERPVKLGDLNGDSNVNQTDINLLKQVVSYGTSYNPNGCNIIYRNFAADLNKDGNINSTDTNLLTNATMSSAGINYEFIR